MPDLPSAPAAARTAGVWQLLRAAFDEHAAGRRLHVVDVGGGSGGFAVGVAELGHAVTVVDPSPDSLAALERRVAEAGVAAPVRGLQGDVADLRALVGVAGCDAVLCHNVLEYVEDPAAALAAVGAVLRPDGFVSVLAANRYAAVLARVLAGQLAEAEHALSDPAGRYGPADALRRRYDPAGLLAALAAAGLRASRVHGVRVFADLVPGGVVEADPAAGEHLLALERAAAGVAELRGVAARLHVLAVPA